MGVWPQAKIFLALFCTRAVPNGPPIFIQLFQENVVENNKTDKHERDDGKILALLCQNGCV
jgi:hypothetical protein